MNINVIWISERLVQASVDEVNSGVMDSEEAKELAIHLITVAGELLEVAKKEVSA